MPAHKLLDYVQLDYWRWGMPEYQIINIIDDEDGDTTYVVVSPEGLVKVTTEVHTKDEFDY